MKINNKAFTLVELLVVVLIIGILAAIAMPQYQKAVAKAGYAKLKPLVNAIANAEEEFYLTTGHYTVNINELSLSWPDKPNEITCDNNGCDYMFDWGYCSLNLYRNATNPYRVVCENSSAHIRYRRILQNNDSEYAGKQGCNAVKENAIAEEICKSEGSNTYMLDPGVGNIYYF